MWRRLYSCCEPDSEDYDSSPSSSHHPGNDDVKSDDEFIVHSVEPRPLQQQQELRQELQEQEQELLMQQHQLQQLQEQQQRRHMLQQQQGEEEDGEDEDDEEDEPSQAVAVQGRQGREANSRKNSRVQTTGIGDQDHGGSTSSRRRAESNSRPPTHEDLDERQTRLDNTSGGSEWAHSPAATDDTRMMSPQTEGYSTVMQHNNVTEEEVRGSPQHLC